jgi:hypothetical protein
MLARPLTPLVPKSLVKAVTVLVFVFLALYSVCVFLRRTNPSSGEALSGENCETCMRGLARRTVESSMHCSGGSLLIFHWLQSG